MATTYHQPIPHRPLKLLNRDDVYFRKTQTIAKRKSAVELLQETKPLYVQSETVLDRKQELRRSLRNYQLASETLEPRHYPNSDPPIRSHCATSLPNSATGITSGGANVPFPLPKSPRLIPPPLAFRKSTSSLQLQNKLRKLLNADSKENLVSEVSDKHSVSDPNTPKLSCSKGEDETLRSHYDFDASRTVCHKSLPDLSNVHDSSSESEKSDHASFALRTCSVSSDGVCRKSTHTDCVSMASCKNGYLHASEFSESQIDSIFDHTDGSLPNSSPSSPVKSCTSYITPPPLYCDNSEEYRNNVISRSKSDVGSRPANLSSLQSVEIPVPDSSNLNMFFDNLGLESNEYSSLTMCVRSNTSSPVYFASSSSSVDSIGGRGSGGGGYEPVADHTLPSIVERNARIIKWLCNCRKAFNQDQYAMDMLIASEDELDDSENIEVVSVETFSDENNEASDENITVLFVDESLGLSKSEINLISESGYKQCNRQQDYQWQQESDDDNYIYSIVNEENYQSVSEENNENSPMNHNEFARKITKNKKTREKLLADSKYASMWYGWMKYCVGDFVYTSLPDKSASVVVCIRRLWINSKGDKMAWCNRYYKPSEVQKAREHFCLPKEIFESDQHFAVRLHNISGKCTVVDPEYYLMNKSTFDDEQDTYVCISKYSVKQNDYSLIHPFDYQKCERDGIKLLKIGDGKSFRKRTKDGMVYCAICMQTYRYKFNLKSHIVKSGHYLGSYSMDFNEAKKVVPEGYECQTIEFVRYDDTTYKASFLLTGTLTLNVMREFVIDFMNKNNCVYVRKTLKRNKGKRTVQVERYVCQHYSLKLNSKRRTKGTNCRSYINTALKCNNDDGILDQCLIRVDFNHNHELTTAAALHYRKPGQAVYAMFTELFALGLSATNAWYAHTEHLKIQESESDQCIHDRSICPDTPWVNHLYKETLTSKRLSIVCLRRELCLGNENVSRWRMCMTSDGWAACVTTAMMERALESPAAAEMMFIDSTVVIERFAIKVFLLFAKTDVGDIPLGVILTSDEEESQLRAGFELYLNGLDMKAFGGRGRAGPMNIIVDDGPVKRYGFKRNVRKVIKTLFPYCILRMSYPKSPLRMCIFHMLQAMWRVLCLPCNNVQVEDRASIYGLYKQILHSPDKKILQTNMEKLLRHPVVKSTKNLKLFLTRMYRLKEKWAVYYRDALTQTVGNSENVVEMGVRVLKARMGRLLREQRLLAFCELVQREFDDYFADKMMAICSGDEHESAGRIYETTENVAAYEREWQCDGIVCLRHRRKRTRYLINTDIGTCSCWRGYTAQLCKHQEVVANGGLYYRIVQMPNTVEQMLALYYIGCGQKTSPTPQQYTILGGILFADSRDSIVADVSYLVSGQEIVHEVEIMESGDLMHIDTGKSDTETEAYINSDTDDCSQLVEIVQSNENNLININSGFQIFMEPESTSEYIFSS